ncbi:hypoxanthine phosphoribosyltransferase [Tepidimicrobium xylanilyticum]|uniref:Hypoxanthine phosphoribosyltransferase n=1 Tax=Tepidimicrobium xylanilyticum TaxID=1123352 RepID=A0A1H3BE90_9FIRM|nr:hypoxanthine phosphoribosyltransferase [Tepidimicrobium xylanilyticum]GMG96923.1 hypoxanthine phosphoribosyltransferase [Tepidimicrobium xylanilyticum]SDX40216.1 hypoxanthine phosphoribosyltransferase [Tepidimicrobium xylanilyticum]
MAKEKNQRILFSSKEISERVNELGKEITRDYDGNDIVVISLLRGSFVFAADLVRSIEVPVNIDFMITSSYGHEEVSSGKVDIIADIRTSIEGKHVLIVDDIMDSGFTMSKVIEYVEKKKPESIKVCVMLDKPSRRKVEISPDYVGFKIPDVFIVGYGLDYGDYYRNTPYIFTFDD